LHLLALFRPKQTKFELFIDIGFEICGAAGFSPMRFSQRLLPKFITPKNSKKKLTYPTPTLTLKIFGKRADFWILGKCLRGSCIWEKPRL